MLSVHDSGIRYETEAKPYCIDLISILAVSNLLQVFCVS